MRPSRYCSETAPLGLKYAATPVTIEAIVPESSCTNLSPLGARPWFRRVRALPATVSDEIAVRAVLFV
jgi:hypothetical protein